jgi:hypothetical protein
VSDRADRVSAGQAVVDAIITDTERITRCAARLDLVALLIRVRIPLVVRSSSCVTRPAAAVKPQPEVRRRPEARWRVVLRARGARWGRGQARRPQHELQPTSAGRSIIGTISPRPFVGRQRSGASLGRRCSSGRCL